MIKQAADTLPVLQTPLSGDLRALLCNRFYTTPLEFHEALCPEPAIAATFCLPTIGRRGKMLAGVQVTSTKDYVVIERHGVTDILPEVSDRPRALHLFRMHGHDTLVLAFGGDRAVSVFTLGVVGSVGTGGDRPAFVSRLSSQNVTGITTDPHASRLFYAIDRPEPRSRFPGQHRSLICFAKMDQLRRVSFPDEHHIFSASRSVTALAVSSSPRSIAIGYADGGIEVRKLDRSFQPDDHQAIASFHTAAGQPISALTFAGSRCLIAGDGAGHVFQLDYNAGLGDLTAFAPAYKNRGGVKALAVSRDQCARNEFDLSVLFDAAPRR